MAHTGWSSGGDAVFSATNIAAGAGLVTLSTAITANSVTVGTTNYVFTDGGNTANTLTVNAITNTQTTLFSNNIVNAGGFTKGGSGLLTLLASSPNLTGPITVAGGTLVCGSQTSATQTGPTGFGNVSIATNATFKVAISNSTTYAQSFSGGGSLFLQGNSYKTSLTLGTANTFAGNLTVNGCTANFTSVNDGSPCSLGNGTNLVLATSASATLLVYQGYGDTTSRRLTLASTTTPEGELDASGFGPLVWAGPVGFATTNIHTLTLGGTSGYLNTFAGAIGDGPLGVTSLNKVGGPGIWMLTGSNSYSGGTTISAGLLLVTNDTALGAPNGPIYLNSGSAAGASYEARLASISNSVTLNPARTIVLLGTNSGAFAVYDTNSLTIPCYITGTNGLFKYASSFALGWVVFSGETNDYTGDFGTAQGNTAFTSVADQGIASSLGKGKASTGGAIAISVGAAGTLRYIGANNSATHRPLLISTTTVGYTLDVTNTGTIAWLNQTNLFVSANANQVINLIGSNTGTNTFAQCINDVSGYASSLNKNGGGQWLVTGTNTFSGTTTVSQGTLTVSSLNYVSAGSLSPNASSSLGHPTTVANGTIGLGNSFNSGTLNYTGTGETSDRVINLAGTTGGATLQQSGTVLLKFTGALTATGVGNKTLTLSGSTAGAGELDGAIPNDTTGTNQTSLVKAGSGTWTLKAANTFTGNTTISNGVLALAGGGSLASSNLFVLGGATLDVTAVTGGTYALAAGQTLFATNGGTAIIKGSVNAASSALEIAYTNGVPAISVANGSLTLSASTPLALNVNNGGGLLPAGTYTLITNGAAGAVAGTVPSSVSVSGDVPGTATLAIVGGNLVLTVPSAALYPPVLSGISTTAGNVILSFSGTNGQSYHVLTSTNLSVPLSNWVSIASGTLTGSTLYYTNGPATNAQRFFDIQSP